MHLVAKSLWNPLAVDCVFAILCIELDNGESPFNGQPIEWGLGLLWFITLDHGGNGRKQELMII
jgi:hypothetical protein